MNLFKVVWRKTLLHRIIDFTSCTYNYIKDKYYISDTFYSKELNIVLRKYLNVEFKKDWIGRLYGVINPNIDIDGNYNFNNMIIELDGENTNNNDFVKNWVYRQMNLVGNLFKIEKLYDYIDVTFKHVGPQNQDNYLIIFDIVSRKLLAESAKRLIKRLFVLGIIGAGVVWGLLHFNVI